MLEHGPKRDETDWISSQIWGRRLKWGGAPVLAEGRNRYGNNFNAGWAVGGSTTHHFANWPRLQPADFEMKSRHDRGLDWPIGYDDLRPYYDRVQADIGISGDAAAEVWRPPGAPYPLPPLKPFRHADIVADGMRKLGMRVAPLPSAILSAPYRNRAACIYDGWCHAGCPIGAVGNAQAVYLPEAVKAGAEIRPSSYVTRVLTDAKGDRAVGVEYYGEDRQLVIQPAEVVVLAAFVVQNPRILLNSATHRHRDGLANSSGLLGRYAMTHTGAGVWGIFDENVENHMGVTGGLLMSQDGYAKDARPGLFGSTMWQVGFAQKPNDILGFANSRGAVFGQDLHAHMKQAAGGLTRMLGLSEALPNADNRIVLADQKDEFGVPLRKQMMPDLKAIYRAETAEAALDRLAEFEGKWDARYPAIGQSWRRAWEHVIPLFAFPPDIRKMIYTTNAVESLNRSLRKIIKTRGSFPNDEAAMKLLYLAIQNAGIHWRRPVEWTAAMGQFAILFGDRFAISPK